MGVLKVNSEVEVLTPTYKLVVDGIENTDFKSTVTHCLLFFRVIVARKLLVSVIYRIL